MHLAAKDGHADVVEIFLDAQASKNVKNKVRGGRGWGSNSDRKGPRATGTSPCHLCMRSCENFRETYLSNFQNINYTIYLETCVGMVGERLSIRTAKSKNANT